VNFCGRLVPWPHQLGDVRPESATERRPEKCLTALRATKGDENGREPGVSSFCAEARRLLAGELMLSFVPEPEQRRWRLMTRGRL
jgi:hypothetical protein